MKSPCLGSQDFIHKEELMFINHTVFLFFHPSFLFCSIHPVCSSPCVRAGFIDFIVEPTFSGLIDTTEKVIGPLIEEEIKAKETGNRRSRYYYLLSSLLWEKC